MKIKNEHPQQRLVNAALLVSTPLKKDSSSHLHKPLLQ